MAKVAKKTTRTRRRDRKNIEKGSECAKYGLINPAFAYALDSHK